MGKDYSNASGLPLSLNVKNTFIDVRSSFIEDEGEGDDVAFLFNSQAKRQISEPAPSIQRQISGRAAAASNARFSSRVTGQPVEEEKEGDDLDGPYGLGAEDEPETEEDPAWVFGRQQTDLNPASPFAFRRQETEQHWPAWETHAKEDQEPKLVQLGDSSATSVWMQAAGMALPARPPAGQPLDLPDDLPAHPAMVPWPQGSGLAAAAGHLLGLPGLAGGAGGALPACPGLPAGGAAAAGPNAPAEWTDTLTVMMRNLPNRYTQHMLLEELNSAGFLGTFDFLYLPIDPETHANRGYAFINFITPAFARLLKTTYEGRKMTYFNSDKVVSVVPAALQGFEANYAHYSRARVNRGAPAARPLFLRESTMQNFVIKHEGGRKRGGRRGAGSLIDAAARQRAQQQQEQTQRQLIRLPSAPMQDADQKGATGAARPSAGGNAAAQPAANLQMRFCPYCGSGVHPEFRFCQCCGSNLNGTS